MNNYIQSRIKRNPNSSVVIPSSAPIIYFGNFENAKVATLGINPSKNEFFEKGTELTGSKRRFHSVSSLAANDLSSLTETQVQMVIESCHNYFIGNPYKRWFDKLESNILSKLSVSYYNGSACHLDIVQWATNPIWRSINKEDRIKLIQYDILFLTNLLREDKIEILLINGQGATEIFKSFYLPQLIYTETISISGETCYLSVYEMKFFRKKVRVLSWSKNLQSTIGLTNKMRDEIGSWLLSHC